MTSAASRTANRPSATISPIRQWLHQRDVARRASVSSARIAHVMRDIVGLRYEHDFDNATTWRTQFTYDLMETASNSLLRRNSSAAPAVRWRDGASCWLQRLDRRHQSWRALRPAGDALSRLLLRRSQNRQSAVFARFPTCGIMARSAARSAISNPITPISASRAREEIALTPQLTAAIGFSSNWNRVSGVYTVYNYASNGTRRDRRQVGVDNDYWNTRSGSLAHLSLQPGMAIPRALCDGLWHAEFHESHQYADGRGQQYAR